MGRGSVCLSVMLFVKGFWCNFVNRLGMDQGVSDWLDFSGDPDTFSGFWIIIQDSFPLGDGT